MATDASVIPELLAELEGRWRVLSSAEDTTRAEFLLGDAWREIGRVDGLEARMAADAGLAADVRMVACNAVRRAMIAEGRLGVTEEEKTDGPFSRRLRYATTETAQLEFTDAERRILEGTAVAAAASAAEPRWTGAHLPAVVVTVPGWRPW